ncbi:MAG: prepilin-type N-terminal cleavage/methylation domain-containing protein [Burkholderiaceae bacterium]|jgi:general secretion pathway protein H|nr:prepilin-type N-terminal cleavage/methylation domain-containing protein [Burkholderiaceae bacterium]
MNGFLKNRRHSRGDGAAAGFTLLELLVVLVLAAITVAVAGGAAYSAWEQASYRQALRDVARQLNQARQQSLEEGRFVAVTFDTGTRQLLVDGRAAPLAIADAVQIHWTALERAGGDAAAAASNEKLIFLFNPDGGARGGQLALVRGARGVAFRVNWLLGTLEQTPYVAAAS